MSTPDDGTPFDLDRLRLCFEGAVPAVIATADAAGTPNVTYLSKVRLVDGDHIALSNQFLSKTVRNLAANPQASVLLIDPVSYDEYRLSLRYERTERRGVLFDRMSDDIDDIAALQGMQDVFRLRAADIYRVVDVEVRPGRDRAPRHDRTDPGPPRPPRARPDPVTEGLHLSELSLRLSRSSDLDTLVAGVVDGLAELFGFEHSVMLLVDEDGERLYTIASHGYPAQGVGSELVVGEGPIGMAAARCTAIRLGNLRQMAKYSRNVRRRYEDRAGIAPGREIPFPGLRDAQSQLAVPAQAMGQLVGVLMVESTSPVAFDERDQALLTVVAGLVANAVEVERARAGADTTSPGAAAGTPAREGRGPVTQVRYFPVDGSTFLGGDYLIKGVAGRILWSLLRAHQDDGRVEFTNREVRLDPSLELPAFRDNFESRLILLKRRLDERSAPIRIEKTGRGRFRLLVDGPLQLDAVGDPGS